MVQQYGKEQRFLRKLELVCVPTIPLLVTQSCLTLCDPMDCSLRGSSVHGISQERIVKWAANSYSRGSSWPKDQAPISVSPALAGRFFMTVPPRKPKYPDKIIIQKDKHTPVFTVALLTTAKKWKQRKSALTGEWIKKWYTQTKDCYSATRKNEIMPRAATWMNPEITILSEVSQTEKDKHHMTSFIYRNLKHDTNDLIWETDSQPQGTGLRLPGVGGGGRRRDWESGVSRFKLLHTGGIRNKMLLHSTGTYIQYHIINNMEKNMKKNVYMNH